MVAAGDHGVLAQGVSPWPAEVTALMVGQFCAGRAAVNALAATVGAQVSRARRRAWPATCPVIPACAVARAPPGTADLSREPAMTREEAARAVLAGAGLAEELTGAGVDLLVTGDMGIGNTTPAAALIAAFTGAARRRGHRAPAPAATPSASGTRPRSCERALARTSPSADDRSGVLAALGGLEHAALAGLVLGGAVARVPVVLDGVSTLAAALAARALAPAALGYLVAGHRSPEPGATVALAAPRARAPARARHAARRGHRRAAGRAARAGGAAVLAGMATFAEAGIAA